MYNSNCGATVCFLTRYDGVLREPKPKLFGELLRKYHTRGAVRQTHPPLVSFLPDVDISTTPISDNKVSLRMKLRFQNKKAEKYKELPLMTMEYPYS